MIVKIATTIVRGRKIWQFKRIPPQIPKNATNQTKSGEKKFQVNVWEFAGLGYH